MNIINGQTMIYVNRAWIVVVTWPDDSAIAALMQMNRSWHIVV